MEARRVPTGDGTVDVNDLTIVLAHYNDSVSASGGGLAATPEPGTLLLVAACITSLIMYAGWRRKAHRLDRISGLGVEFVRSHRAID